MYTNIMQGNPYLFIYLIVVFRFGWCCKWI